MLDQIKSFSLEDKIVDFIKISENLSHYNLSPKICIRLWESLKKKLKDLYKRENEFQALCRNEVNIDFWTESIYTFKQRINAYEEALDAQKEEASVKENLNFLEAFQTQETKHEDMINSYFLLFDDPTKFVSVMGDLSTKLTESSADQIGFQDENQISSSKIDQVLNELVSEI